jgi:hypothetical protein
MSDNTSKGKYVVEQWFFSLTKDDLKLESMENNFYTLINTFKCLNIEFEEAHFLVKHAINLVKPSTDIVKHVYKKNKRFQSLQEFEDSWVSKINKIAMEAFFHLYPVMEIESPPDDLKLGKQLIENLSSKTEDEELEEMFYKNTKLVTRENKWLFHREDGDDKK